VTQGGKVKSEKKNIELMVHGIGAGGRGGKQHKASGRSLKRARGTTFEAKSY